MEPITPQDAQRIVAAYLQVVETHASSDVYPCALGDLPESKEHIRAAFRICVMTLASTGQLTPELREYLEVGYVSLADYVSDECVTLLREYGRAGEALAAGPTIARERVATEAWRQISDQSRLAGQLARAISDEADALRAEFRSWSSTAATIS